MASSALLKFRAALLQDRGLAIAPRGRWVVLAWLLCCATLFWLSRDNLATLNFRDPDDAMRLQQVRDWIAGQPFLDVSQHRVNPPLGGPMHWSRLVDMPLAAMILLLRPVLDARMAETIACVLVPLFLLGGLTAAIYIATRRIGGQALALLAAVLLLATPTILVQFGALRIDHHGWQILMATIALAGAMDRRRVRGGTIAGIAIAVWLQISSEGLPYAAFFAAIFALWQWRAREETSRFIAYATSLGGAALVLLALLRGAPALMQQQCDALSAAYVWPLAAFAITTPLAYRWMKPTSAGRRFMAAMLGGAAAVATFLMTGHQCLTGDPFQALGPVAYKLWYLNVMEGRPVWEQDRSMIGLIILPSIVGLVGSIVAARAAADARTRERWIALTLLLAGAAIVAMLVMRAMSVAHVFALPGIAWLILRLFQRAQQQQILLTRVFASSAVAMLTPAALCAIWVVLMTAADTRANDSSPPASECRTASALAPLRLLPTSTLFAPLDIGPDILIRTRHSLIGTAHHRNAAGITAVVEGFTAAPDRARAILARLNGGKGPDYLIACPGLNEFKHYAKEHRASLAAMLDRGATPGWLRPVPLPGSKGLRVY
ncbi:MAG TPA: hypothetical protein VF442_13640, partial [Sphingobium sp.]